MISAIKNPIIKPIFNTFNRHIIGSPPGPVFPDTVDDDFTGADGSLPNNVLWTSSGGAVIQSNELAADLDATTTGSTLYSNFLVGGDFEITMDYRFDSISGVATDYYTRFEVRENDFALARFFLQYIGNATLRIYGNMNGVVTTDDVGISSHVNTTLRVTRVGATLYFWQGSPGSWSVVGNAAGYYLGSGAIRFYSLVNVFGSNPTLSLARDNFTLVSGDIIWPNADGEINDYFIQDLDTPPNETLWTPIVADGCSLLASGSDMRMTLPTSVTADWVQMTTKYALSGDVRIETGWQIISQTNPSSSASYPTLLRIYHGADYLQIATYLNSSGDQLYIFSGTGQTTSSFATTDTTGKFLVKRVAGVFTFYVWQGGAWKWNGSTSGKTPTGDWSTENLIARLASHSDFDGSVTADFDYFIVPVGTPVWP